MAGNASLTELGEPALKIAGFQLWIHGREFPDAIDLYDGNWLRITAHCGAIGASIWVQGAILTILDIERFQSQCQGLMNETVGLASLDSFEPELKVAIEPVDRLGHMRVRVEITPDHLSQSHRLDFEIDRSHLPAIEKACSAIVATYPIRGRGDTG
jgi:hypothetical protein